MEENNEIDLMYTIAGIIIIRISINDRIIYVQRYELKIICGYVYVNINAVQVTEI